jgi:uncharacterized membrane protein
VLFGWALVILPNLARESLWLDELFSAYSSFTPRTLPELFTDHILKDVHPPLYPVFLYFWGRLVGQGEFIARLPSALTVGVGLLGSHALLGPVISRRANALYLLVLGFTAGTVYYAQELRWYGFLLASSSVLSALYVRFRSAISSEHPIAPRFLWLYGGVAALAVYTHLYANLLIASLALPLLVEANRHRQNTTLKRLLFANGVVAALSAVWLAVHFTRGPLADKLAGHFWIQEADLGAHLWRFVRLLASNAWSATGYAVLALTLLVLGRRHTLFRSSRTLLGPVLSVFVLASVVSLHTPTITARNLIVTLPLIALFVAEAADAAYPFAKGPILVFLALLLTGGVVHSFRFKKEEWRQAALYVRKRFSPKTCVVPLRDLVDPDHGQDFSIYPYYYLGDTFRFTTMGPVVQPECDLILYDAHVTDENGVEALLAKYGIRTPHEIVKFRAAYVVVRRESAGVPQSGP